MANTGGRNGTFTGQIQVTKGRSNTTANVSIDDVQPGKVGKANDTAISFPAADTYTLSLTGTNATHTVTVDPIVKQPGQSLAFSDSLTATVKSARFTPALFFTIQSGFNTSKQPGLVAASSDKILAFVRMRFENTGTESIEFNPTAIAPTKGSYYSSLPDSRAGGLSAISNINGSPLSRPVRLSAGGQTEGWLLAQVPRSAAKQVFSLGYQVDGAKTPPEVEWRFPPKSGSRRKLPSFSLQNFSMPKQVEVGTERQYSFTVKNTGTGGGMFRAVSQFRPPDGQNWVGFHRHSARLQPGATKTFKPTMGYGSLGGGNYRIRPFDGQQRSVTFVPATRSFGKGYTTPGGVKITLNGLQASGFYVINESWADRTTPDSGQHYLLVRVNTKVIEQQADGISNEDFTINHNGTSYDIEYPVSDLKQPVRGGLFTESGETQSATSTGWLVFAVPQTITPQNVTIQWSQDNATVRWQAGQNSSTTSSPATPSSTTTGR
ncbi:hypothetical protein [Halococcus salifodinae]|uniref:hypothetical protein n=1 Tax=Halococcus salifodinae TaxID=36738 RepID=UPI00126861A6|nr:hypothetical protein [Halococcus salifodinae]